MRWIDDVADWGGERPATLVVRARDSAERHAHLRALAARALGLDRAAVEVLHAEGRAPRLVRPECGLVLSSASRGGLAALSVADGPVGADVELEGPAGEVPWQVLHPAEREALGALPALLLGRAFARLWSLKEAYLKALGTGLAREPGSFAVYLTGPDRAAIEDGRAPAPVIEARTTWRRVGGRRAAVSAVLLAPPDQWSP